MSNVLAVAAVTSTLRFLLDKALGADEPGQVGGAKVTTLRPDRLRDTSVAEDVAAGINLYLYHVAPNQAFGQRNLPTRRSDGSLARLPNAALDLNYLLTFYGDDTKLEAQRLLARAVAQLARVPILTRDLVRDAMTALAGQPGTDLGFLAKADLADAAETVKLAPQPLLLEELSKLWSVLFQTPYLLSVAYTATVVVVEAAVTPSHSLPVRHLDLQVRPDIWPRLHRVVPVGGPDVPVTAGTVLTLHGSGLRGARTRVRIGTVSLPVQEGGPASLTVALGVEVPAGESTIHLLHLSEPSPDGAPGRVTAWSNHLPLLVRPTVSVGSVAEDKITLQLSPPLFPGQRAELVLTGASGQTTILPLRAPDEGQPAQAAVSVSRGAVPDGEWLVRVHVDGVSSLPERDGEVYSAPKLVLPP
ncbi:DUF4255 domain-containing protein [Actinomadura namibiensis]|uniref:DUF4255 domain-containing protein n=1 Tax=Actinomadura kijaniata TaxID=46161 RepID=UPI00360DC985